MSDLAIIKDVKIPISINEEVKYINYDLNAFAELEEIYGTMEAMQEALNSGSIKAIRKFLWAGLIHENKDLTEEEVGKWFNVINMPIVSKKINEALGLAIPMNKEPKKEVPSSKKVRNQVQKNS